MHFLLTCIALAGVLVAGTTAPAAAADGGTVDNSIYAELLDAHLEGGLVDYEGFRRDEPRLDGYLDILAGVDPASLDRDERFAFYVNVYNAWTIKLILMHWPVDSIKDIGSIFSSPWSKEFIRLDGETVTLDHVEHEILREEWDDPRVHFAVNCASLSCPPLRHEPYAGARLDAQLDEQTRAFLNDRKHTYMDDEVLYVSKIFDWFDEDWGGTEEGVVDFVLRYAEPSFASRIKAAGEELDLEYLKYDWSLNAQSKP